MKRVWTIHKDQRDQEIAESKRESEKKDKEEKDKEDEKKKNEEAAATKTLWWFFSWLYHSIKKKNSNSFHMPSSILWDL